jgi:hypothetical protein
MDGKHLYPHLQGSNIQYIDRDWIDQRLYEQEDEMFQISVPGEGRSLSFAFGQLPSQKLAAVIILGERDYLVPMLQYSPFQRSERTPRESQFFQVNRENHATGWRWYLKYGGNFTAKKSQMPETTNSNSNHLQGQQYLSGASTTGAVLNSRSRQSSPSTNISVKRRRTETSSDN